MRAARFFFLFAFLFSFSAQAQQTIRIGAWNIEHLGNEGSRGGVGHGVAQSADDLADYIRASGVDILALEEITADASPSTNTTINRALQRIREETGDRWRHILFPKFSGSTNQRRHQRIGVAWNTARVTRVSDVFKIAVPNIVDIPGPDDSIWARHPHAVKFRLGAQGRTDIVVIPLHLKANTNDPPLPVNKRAAEARTLVEQLPAIRQKFRDRDIVLIGDTNFLSPDEPAKQTLRAAGFRDLNAENEGTHLGGGPFDRAIVPADQQEFAGCDQRVFDDEFLQLRNIDDTEFRARFSDHFMIVTQVRVLEDDDN